MVSASSPAFVRRPRPSGVGPIALIILDGFGLRDERVGNAVALAEKPVYDALWATYPHTVLQASEEAVGLPPGQFGNSEVGHSNIGAGRILYQDLTRLNRDIDNGAFYDNPTLQAAIQHALHNGTALHLYGLVSDGGVHSHLNHLLALLRMAARQGLSRVFVHAFLDGRDTAPNTGVGYIQRLLDVMQETGTGRIATIQGRYYAMDRDKRWERTEKAYRAMVYGDGIHAVDPLQALRDSYHQSLTDEFVLPAVMVDVDDQPIGLIHDDDAVIMFNFRPDRAIQITQVFTNEDFRGFDRGPAWPHVYYVCMTRFSETVGGYVAYALTNLDNTLGEVLAQHGLTQLRVAETEKYPHVTYFFSGGREQPFPGEERLLIPSPRVATYDLQPEMSANEIADAAAARLRTGEIDVMILNFANADMVGHTGLLEAAIAAVETVDACLGRVLAAIEEQGGIALVTADHGNADEMIDPVTGGPCTTHTLSLVPLIVTKPGIALRRGILADLAPTMLALLDIPQPPEMSGQSLLESGL